MWGFQSRLSLICNTLISAAPQLFHLVLIIILVLSMLSMLVVLGIGYRVKPASSFGEAFYDTFMAVLGGTLIHKADLMPVSEIMSVPQYFVALLILYLRELLLVFLLFNFFMATIGETMIRVKRKMTSSQTIPKDLKTIVIPDLEASMIRLVKTAWNRKHTKGDPPNSDGDAGSSHAGSDVVEPLDSAAVKSWIKQHYPGLVPPKSFGDKVPSVKIGDQYLNLQQLQQLLVDLSMDGIAAAELMQLPAAKQHQDKNSADACGGSVVQEAVDAGADGRVVAAAVAVADRLMESMSDLVDDQTLQRVGKVQLDTHVGTAASSSGPEVRVGCRSIILKHAETDVCLQFCCFSCDQDP